MRICKVIRMKERFLWGIALSVAMLEVILGVFLGVVDCCENELEMEVELLKERETLSTSPRSFVFGCV